MEAVVKEYQAQILTLSSRCTMLAAEIAQLKAMNAALGKALDEAQAPSRESAPEPAPPHLGVDP